MEAAEQPRTHPALPKLLGNAAVSAIAPPAHCAAGGVVKKQSKKRAPPPPSLNLGLQSTNQFAGECPIALDSVVRG